MKEIYIILCLFVFSIGIAQEPQKTKKTLSEKKHEVKLGAIKMLAGPIFEGTYEYIKSKDFTYGSSLLVNLNTGNDYPEDFSITPFARFYFQETKEYGAYGFFVEGFGKYSSGNYYNNYSINNSKTKYNAAALGLSLGKKWVNNSGFVFEILVGAGRTLGNSDSIPDAIFRGDLNIGYRF
ncbi:hypothetical protein [Flavobacterium sp.]|uniref:hypothetical protein n=1 Tax=Flavobacterium sp. TaxID=239 RepID=UPI0037517875